MWERIGEPGQISDRIERQILALLEAEELRPGDRLPSERELAALMGVSRPSVREAVKSLEAHGRLRVRHGQGVFVADAASARDLRATLAQQEITLGELFAMREVLEVPAAGWAAQAGDRALLAAAGDALTELNEVVDRRPDDFDALEKLDSAFHMRIVEAAGNRFLNQTLGVLQDMMMAGMETTLRIPGRVGRSRAQHERIMAALLAGDANGSRAATRQHIRDAHAAAVRRIEAELLGSQDSA